MELQFEQQIGDNMTLSLAYVGDKGTHLITYYNYNRQQYGDPQCSNSNPTGCNFPALGAINTQATIGNSTYNSLQTVLNAASRQSAVSGELHLVARNRRFPGCLRHLQHQRSIAGELSRFGS